MPYNFFRRESPASRNSRQTRRGRSPGISTNLWASSPESLGSSSPYGFGSSSRDAMGEGHARAEPLANKAPSPSPPFSPRFFRRVRAEQYTPHAAPQTSEPKLTGLGLLLVEGHGLPLEVEVEVPVAAQSEHLSFDPQRIGEHALYHVRVVASATRSADVVSALSQAGLLGRNRRIERDIRPEEFAATLTGSSHFAALNLSPAEQQGVLAYLRATRNVRLEPAETLNDMPKSARPFFLYEQQVATREQSAWVMHTLRERGVLDLAFLPRDMSQLNSQLFRDIGHQLPLFHDIASLYEIPFFGRLLRSEQRLPKKKSEWLVRILDDRPPPAYSADASRKELSLDAQTLYPMPPK